MSRNENYDYEKDDARKSLNTQPVGNADRSESFPVAPPPLEDDPCLRLAQHEGFEEVDYDPDKRSLVPLTQAEIRTLARHHLDRVHRFQAFKKCGGSFGSSDIHRDYYHRGRFAELTDFLSKADCEKFNELIRIRDKYIDTLRDPEEDLQ